MKHIPFIGVRDYIGAAIGVRDYIGAPAFYYKADRRAKDYIGAYIHMI